MERFVLFMGDLDEPQGGADDVVGVGPLEWCKEQLQEAIDRDGAFRWAHIAHAETMKIVLRLDVKRGEMLPVLVNGLPKYGPDTFRWVEA